MSAGVEAAAGTRPVAPDPEFMVAGAAARHHAAQPALELEVHVTEPTGRPVHLIALSVQVLLEPARRDYAAAERERLVELFGPPERWATTTQSLVWHRADVVVPAFTGATTFAVPVPCTLDLDVAAARWFHAVRAGEAPLALNFSGTIHHRGDDGRPQMAPVPWSCSAEFRMPVGLWHDAVAEVFPATRWVALHTDTLDALLAAKARMAAPTVDAAVAALLREAGA